LGGDGLESSPPIKTVWELGMGEKQIVLTEEFLDELFRDISNQTAGKLCSVIETVLEKDLETSELLKKLLKNLIYQQFREVLYRIQAFQSGVQAIKITHKPTSIK